MRLESNTHGRYQQWCYTTFGSTITERSGGFGESYRFGMNTQEKEHELGEGVTSAEYWMYDGKLGRRWNVDPKRNESLSTFACFANNPLSNIDILGDTLTEILQEAVNKLKTEVIADIESLKLLKTKLLKPLPQGGSYAEGGNTDMIWNEIDIIDATLNELSGFLVEIEAMENSSVWFDLEVDATKYKDGGTRVLNKVVLITLNSLDEGGMYILGHELKHGFQYLSGENSYDEFNKSLGICADIYDEVAAYKRQWALMYFSGKNTINYQEITPALIKEIGLGVYDNYYGESIDKNTILTHELLKHYFGENPIPKEAHELIGKPVHLLMDLYGEFYK